MNKDYIEPETAAEVWADDDPEVGYQVLTLDPGGTSGWSVFQVHLEAMSGNPEYRVLDNVLWWTAGQFTGKQDDQIDLIMELVNSWPNARLVTEDFKLRQGAAYLDPVEINATLRWACRPRYWVKQSASLAMNTVTDDRQKEWGFWLPGKEHARDAVKHAITFLRRKKEQAVAEAMRAARA